MLSWQKSEAEQTAVFQSTVTTRNNICPFTAEEGGKNRKQNTYGHSHKSSDAVGHPVAWLSANVFALPYSLFRVGTSRPRL